MNFARRLSLVLSASVSCCLILPRCSQAYNDDGHFYTTVALEHDRMPAFEDIGRNEAELISFCAQVPDLARELDAVTLFAHSVLSPALPLWVFGNCWGTNTREMFIVHHYVHALTGADAQLTTDASAATLRRLRSGLNSSHFDPNLACAVGLAVHLLGDSFAHRRLHDHTDRMYGPGMGHYRDDHDPDYIDYSKGRETLWEGYVRLLSEAMNIKMNQSQEDALFDSASANLSGGTEENKFHAREIREKLLATLGLNVRIEDWVACNPHVEDMGVGEHILSMSFSDVARRCAVPGAEQLQFEQTWKIFQETAGAEFEARGIPAVCGSK